MPLLELILWPFIILYLALCVLVNCVLIWMVVDALLRWPSLRRLLDRL